MDPSIPATAAKAIEVGHQPQDPMTESRVELGVKVEVSSPTSQGVEKQIKSSMGSTGRHVDGGNAWNIYKDGHETKQRIYAQDESTRDAERATTSRAVGVSVETGGLMPIRAAVGDVSADRGFELAEKADLEVSDDVSDRAEKEERPTTRRGILLANGACDKQEPVCGMEAHDSDKDEKKDREEEADGFSKQAFVPENKEDQQDIHGGKKDKREEEGDDREEDEGDDEEEDEEDDEKEEETVKTDEEHRRELEAAIDPLKVLLVRDNLYGMYMKSRGYAIPLASLSPRREHDLRAAVSSCWSRNICALSSLPRPLLTNSPEHFLRETNAWRGGQTSAL